MAYIGFNPSQLAVAPFATKYFTGDGSTTTFTLDQSVPGANEANVEVFVENVQQNPIDAYTIGGALNNQLIFSEAPVSGAAIYVIHKGEATYNLQPSTGSVTANTLDPVLRNFTVNTFTGDGSTKTFTLTDTPYSPNSILVMVDGIVQTAGVNYTVSGTTLSFDVAPTAAPDSTSNITVVHLGFSSGNKAVMDGSITPVKLSTGGPTWTTTGNLTVTNNLYLGITKSIGIGTTTPTFATVDGYTQKGIHIIGEKESGTAPVIRLSETGSGRGNWEIRSNRFGATSGNVFQIAEATGGTFLTIRGDNDDGGTGTAGFIGIGTDTPLSMLHIKGPYPYIRLEDTDSATGVVGTLTANQDGNIYYDANFTNTATPGGHIWRVNGGGIVMMLEQSGSALGRLNLPYGQIKFPASQNSSTDPNTLDDYEEGNWTPNWTGNQTGSFAYLNNNGYYTKIGRMVTLVWWTQFAANNAAGGLQFSLPFPVSTAAGETRASPAMRFNGSIPSGTQAYAGQGTSYCYFNQNATITNSSGNEIGGTLTYFTT